MKYVTQIGVFSQVYNPQNFNIHVNGELVTIDDLKDLAEATEFLWVINQYSDDYVAGLPALKADISSITAALDLKGFIGTVSKPGQLKIRGTEERATVDLFVNGRLREKNITRHVPTQRIVESYIYGQVHFDAMDQTGDDPFTSSREGIVDDDENFQSLLDFLKREVLPKVFDEWDKLRLARGDEGDEENTRKSKKERRARDLYKAASEDYSPNDDAPGKEQVEEWLTELQDDAEFNIGAYVDCFLSENLVRSFINEQGLETTKRAAKESDEWREKEKSNMDQAGISFELRQNKDDLSYLGMDALVEWAEQKTKVGNRASLLNDAVSYKPVRNVVGHTGLLSDTAKTHLNVTFQNIKARVINLVSQKDTGE